MGTIFRLLHAGSDHIIETVTLGDGTERKMPIMEEPSLPSPRVSPEWLAARLDDPGLRIVDVRWCLRPLRTCWRCPTGSPG